MNSTKTASVFLFVLWLSLLPAMAGDGSRRFLAGSGDRHKIRVSDPAVAQRIEAQGGKVLADYGGFKLMEVNSTATGEFAGDASVEPRDGDNRILLNAGEFDTAAGAATAMRKTSVSFQGRRLHLVQFAGPVKPEWLDKLTAAGVTVVTYIPNNAYLVYGSNASLAKVRDLSGGIVQWEGTYLDDDKIQPRARTRSTQARTAVASAVADLYAIQLVDDAEVNAATRQIIDAVALDSVRTRPAVRGYVNLVARLPVDQVSIIASQPDVVSINTYVEPKKMDERQDMIVAGNLIGTQPSGPGYLTWLATKGFSQEQFSASAFVVDVTDSGVDNGTNRPNHFGLYIAGNTDEASRVVYNRLEGTANSGSTNWGCDGHGTLNAHIIAGYNDLTAFPHVDSQSYHYGLGVCPFVRIGSSVIFDPSSYTYPSYGDLMSKAYRDGARISSDSWGADTAGDYDVDAQEYDALVRDAQPSGSAVPAAGNQEITIVFAAGNAGSSVQTVGSPGTAKNVITVGAAENVHSHSSTNGGNNTAGNDGCTTPDTEANSADDIASFSSRGPCSDLRNKPEIVAPGTHITGGVAQQNRVTTGTGAAIPCFSGEGVCGLPGGGTTGNTNNFFPQKQQFYSTSSGTSHSTPAVAGGCALIRQYFINQSWTAPSPAMVKAFLIAAARYMTGTSANDSLWSNHQGFGMMNLGLAFDGTPRVLRDQDTNDLFTATGQSRQFVGTINSTGKPFRVSLAWTDAPGPTTGNAYKNDLDLVVTLNGRTYKGNVFNGQYSTNGGTADARNNAECVFLPAGQTGVIVVTVSAANINSDGVPNYGGSVDQDFALVIYNATAGASNQPPVLDAIGDRSATTNTLLQFAVTASDPFDGDLITLSATGIPPWATFATVTNLAGVTNTFSGVPPDTGTWVATFFAVDKDGTNRETITILAKAGGCEGTNILSESFDSSTSVPTNWTDGGTANDTSSTHYQSSPNCRGLGTSDTLQTPAVDNPTQIVFYVDSSSGGSGHSATFDYSVNGGSWVQVASFTVTSAGSNRTYALNSSPDLSASTNVKFRFNSTFSTWYLDDVRISGMTCSGGATPRSAPILNAISNRTTIENIPITFAVTATPTDGDAVTLSVSNAPAGSEFSSTNENGSFSWATPTPIGVYTMTFYAADVDGANSEEITLTVNRAGTGSGGSESFSNSTAPSASYGSGSYIGDNGVVWTYNWARTPDTNYQIEGQSMGFADSTRTPRDVYCAAVPGGIGTLSLKYKKYFANPGGAQLRCVRERHRGRIRHGDHEHGSADADDLQPQRGRRRRDPHPRHRLEAVRHRFDRLDRLLGEQSGHEHQRDSGLVGGAVFRRPDELGDERQRRRRH